MRTQFEKKHLTEQRIDTDEVGSRQPQPHPKAWKYTVKNNLFHNINRKILSYHIKSSKRGQCRNNTTCFHFYNLNIIIGIIKRYTVALEMESPPLSWPLKALWKTHYDPPWAGYLQYSMPRMTSLKYNLACSSDKGLSVGTSITGL